MPTYYGTCRNVSFCRVSTENDRYFSTRPRSTFGRCDGKRHILGMQNSRDRNNLVDSRGEGLLLVVEKCFFQLV